MSLPGISIIAGTDIIKQLLSFTAMSAQPYFRSCKLNPRQHSAGALYILTSLSITLQYLLLQAQEGRIDEGSAAWKGMSAKAQEARKQMNTEKDLKLRSPNFVVSRTRLCLQNLPESVDETALRQHVTAAVRSCSNHLLPHASPAARDLCHMTIHAYGRELYLHSNVEQCADDLPALLLQVMAYASMSVGISMRVIGPAGVHASCKTFVPPVQPSLKCSDIYEK